MSNPFEIAKDTIHELSHEQLSQKRKFFEIIGNSQSIVQFTGKEVKYRSVYQDLENKHDKKNSFMTIHTIGIFHPIMNLFNKNTIWKNGKKFGPLYSDAVGII